MPHAHGSPGGVKMLLAVTRGGIHSGALSVAVTCSAPLQRFPSMRSRRRLPEMPRSALTSGLKIPELDITFRRDLAKSGSSGLRSRSSMRDAAAWKTSNVRIWSSGASSLMTRAPGARSTDRAEDLIQPSQRAQRRRVQMVNLLLLIAGVVASDESGVVAVIPDADAVYSIARDI